MNNKYSRSAIYLILIFYIFAFSCFGQNDVNNAVAKNDVVTLKHKSDVLNREMSYRVIFPKNYNTAKNIRFSVLYLLHGLTGNFKNWTDNSKLAEYSRDYPLIIVMPEGHNSWYINSGVVKDDKYESYIIDELIPKIDKDFRTNSSPQGRMIAGLSMGGYGSIKFGLKYTDKFVLVGSFSGALRAAEWIGKDFVGWKVLADSLNNSFGSADSLTRKENNIFKNLESKSREELARMPFFYIDCGTEDGLLKENQEFARLLQEQKVPHEFRQLPGKHDWNFWDSQIQEFLEVTARYLNWSDAKTAK